MWLLIVHQLKDYHKNSTNFQQKMVLKQSGLIGNQLTNWTGFFKYNKPLFHGEKSQFENYFTVLFL